MCARFPLDHKRSRIGLVSSPDRWLGHACDSRQPVLRESGDSNRCRVALARSLQCRAQRAGELFREAINVTAQRRLGETTMDGKTPADFSPRGKQVEPHFPAFAPDALLPSPLI